MCMKKPYMFMTDIVPGPNSIGKDINVCLRPLIDELKILWNTGVKTYDQSLKQNFTMRAAIMWTISDYPAMSMISGWSGKGKMGYQVCLGSMQGFRLKYYGKCSFYGTNRIFLESNDPLRQKSNLFDNEERRLFRGRLSGEGVKELLDGLVFHHPERLIRRALCLLEMIFPQSWFDSMEHLVVHLAEEIRLARPAYWHWMYLIERLLGKLKQKVGNKARVEGSIVQRYMEEEILNICSFYFASDTIHNKVRRNEVLFGVQNSENLEVFNYPIQSLGKEGTRYMSDDERELAEEYVLLNSPEVQPYLRKYQDRVMRQRPETTPQDLDRIVKSRFKTWFKQNVDKDEVEGPRFRDLLEGPVLKVMTFETCQVNGYKFLTKSASGSGIVVKGNLHRNNLDYYGQLHEIIRLIYQGCNHVYLFKCIWFDSVGNGVKIDKNHVITIDMTSRLKSNEIFILASQVSQVYYAPSVLDPKAKIYTMVKSKSRPIDESIIAQNDIEDAFQEDRSNASTSFSLFVDFA
ncbi:uncharacterized protein LOC141691880 [Apium graveolens]|uniref:uncharacterized protein LOC141691880 n=1 Tax=Apium graveolens TaxID=4045 RepID=UPI003D7B4718